jgi:hypothetical protein
MDKDTLRLILDALPFPVVFVDAVTPFDFSTEGPNSIIIRREGTEILLAFQYLRAIMKKAKRE